VTVAAPPPARVPARRRRWGIVLAAAAIVGVLALLAFGSVGGALVYYLTPSELEARGDGAIGDTVRLGGLVEAGSVDRSGGGIVFVLTDGEADITVRSSSLPTASFREGAGAVVEGRLGGDGVFEATRVIVKHDENYAVPASGEVPAEPYVPAEDPGS
jgi:cytochrome c-type biogenesis protein CcmE